MTQFYDDSHSFIFFIHAQVIDRSNSPLAVEDEAEMELGVATGAYPLIHKHRHVLACHREDGLGERDGRDEHVRPHPRRLLLRCCVPREREVLVEHLRK